MFFLPHRFFKFPCASKISWVFCLISFFVILPNSQASNPNDQTTVAGLPSKQLFSAPLYFESNAGQTDEEVKFLARGSGYAVFLTPGEAVLALRRSTQKAAAAHNKPAQLRMKLIGTHNEASVEGLDR